jgi:hypothetical protein
MTALKCFLRDQRGAGLAEDLIGLLLILAFAMLASSVLVVHGNGIPVDARFDAG